MTDAPDHKSNALRALAWRAALFCALQLVVLGWLLRGYHADDRILLASINAKHARLANLPSPRLMLVGGSNVLYGLDSRTIAEEAGMPHVVNMALTSVVGLHFMLKEVEPSVRPGDVVLVSPEYDHFCRNPTSARDLIWLLERRPSVLLGFPAEHWKLVMDRALHHLAAVIRAEVFRKGARPDLGPTHVKWINEYGDNTASRTLLEPPPVAAWQLECSEGRKGLMDEQVERIAEYKRSVETRGARMLLTYPTFDQSQYRKNEADIGELHRRLEALFGPALLTQPNETAIPAASLYDTHYHPDETEKIRRSRLVGQRLAAYLRAQSDTVVEATSRQ